jgi:hypothetical protein
VLRHAKELQYKAKFVFIRDYPPRSIIFHAGLVRKRQFLTVKIVAPAESLPTRFTVRMSYGVPGVRWDPSEDYEVLLGC